MFWAIWIEYQVRSLIAGIGPLIMYFGIGGLIVLGCIAWAYFMPVFKKTALWVALTTTIGLVVYGQGVYDGEHKYKAKEEAAAKVLPKARDSAIKRIDSDKSGRMLSTDKYNRDSTSK